MNSIGLAWHEWFDEEKKDRLIKDFNSIQNLLRRNKLLKITLRKWIREEIAYFNIEAEPNEKIITAIKDDWYHDNLIKKQQDESEEISKETKEKILNSLNMNDQLLDEYCINEYKSLDWATKQWRNMIPQIYLEQKERFDKVRLRSLSCDVSLAGFSEELYYALKDDNETFEGLAKKYKGMVVSTKNTGVEIAIKDMNKQMAYNCSKPGKPTRPFRVENSLAIIEVMEKDYS